RFERERMMHQREQWMARAQRRGDLRQHPEGEAVDHDRMTGRQRRKSCAGRGAGIGRGIRKSVAKVDDLDAPTERRELRDDPRVIGIAASWGRKVARPREGGLPHHSAASYQARASGDSATVTRIDLSSRPSRPSLPARAATASWSKRCLVKNSVVVL